MQQPNELNGKQEAKFNMYRATEAHLDANTGKFSSNTSFQTAYAEFKANIPKISAAAQQKSGSLSGIATDKSNLKDTLSRETARIAGFVFAYASTVGDAPLASEMDFSATDLRRSRDENLAPRCQAIHDKTAARLTELKDYGVTQAKLDALQAAITAYATATPKPRNAASIRKTVNADINALFTAADRILKSRMDKLIEVFRADEPDFVAEYFSNREIVDAPTKSKTPNATAKPKDGDAPK